MVGRPTWDEFALRRGDVVPLPLATEVNWRDNGYEVNVILVLDVSENGYDSTEPIFTRFFASDTVARPDEALRLALIDFGAAVRVILSVD